MLCGEVIDRVNRSLNDPNNTWFSGQGKIDCLNDALRALVSVRPDAASATAVRLLSSGTQQSIPDDGTRLLRVIRNAGEDKGLS